MSLSTIASEEEESKKKGCCGLKKCGPGILLRNIFIPKEMWDAFPDGLSYSVSDYLLYHSDYESRHYVNTPDMYELPFEEVWIDTKDKIKIHAFLIKPNGPDASSLPTVIFLHGNAGNIGNRLDNAKLIYEAWKCNVLLVEYRGFGKSKGSPSEKGLYRDARAAFEYVEGREDLDSKKIILFGRSLGGAVAIHLASRPEFKDRVAALIIENTFTSIPGIAKHLFPFRVVKWLPNFCFKNRYENSKKVASLSCPTLFVLGSYDEMLPTSMMEKLHTRCSSPLKRLSQFDAGHNDTYQCDDYSSKVSEFISEAIIAGTGDHAYGSGSNVKALTAFMDEDNNNIINV